MGLFQFYIHRYKVDGLTQVDPDFSFIVFFLFYLVLSLNFSFFEIFIFLGGLPSMRLISAL